MCNLDSIRKLYEDNRFIYLSEIDTQVLLVEPVLQLAGWDIGNPKVVKRSDRNPSKHQFDIETYLNTDAKEFMRLAIECKSLSTVEFNIKNISSMAGVGKLTQKHHKDLSVYWANKHQDGIGQLRAYCINYQHFSKMDSLAVLTNGFEWLIFNNDIFLSEGTLMAKIADNAIKSRGKLTDTSFEKDIIEYLRNNSI